MDARTFLKAAAVQLLVIGAIFLVLLLAVPHSFFEDWGAVAGPTAWIGGSAISGRILGLSWGRTAAAAAVGGVLAGLATLTGVHTAGLVAAIAGFAAIAALAEDGSLRALPR